MPNYYLAVKNDDRNDCRIFFDKENALDVVKRNPNMHFEERNGRAVEYFNGVNLKTTVVETSTFEETIFFLIGDEEFKQSYDANSKNLYIKTKDKTFILLDFKKNELKE